MVCTQPWCLFKRESFKNEDLAGFIIQILAGKPLQDILPEAGQIVVRPQCTLCALHVMQGRKAYLTQAEWTHLDDLGHWHTRRQRRKHH